MSMRRRPQSLTSRARTSPRISLTRLLGAGGLGVTAALLVSCGSSTGKLIPAADAGPLQGDFEAVANAAQSGNGSCSATETAILKTEQDFAAVPASIDAGLRNTLRQGISNLRDRSLVLCKQPLAQSTTTPTSAKTTTTATTTTPTVTQTTPTQTTPTTTTPTTTTPTTSTPGGGTPAPGAGETPPAGGQGGGTPGEGAGAGGQEGAK
jgi:hypothetical protein